MIAPLKIKGKKTHQTLNDLPNVYIKHTFHTTALQELMLVTSRSRLGKTHTRCYVSSLHCTHQLWRRAAYSVSASFE